LKIYGTVKTLNKSRLPIRKIRNGATVMSSSKDKKPSPRFCIANGNRNWGIAGVDVPSFADEETTFAELQTRLTKTIDFLNTLTPAQIDGSENKPVTLKVGGRELQFTGQVYLLSFVLPNLYFHTTVAYSILRHNGVDVGKMDFLGNPV
jgi:hypothetical protein